MGGTNHLLRPCGEKVPAGRMTGTTETTHMGMCFVQGVSLWEGEAPAEPYL